MKAEHEAESAFDRISTREELCEVMDLLCDTGSATRISPAKTSGRVLTDSDEVLSTEVSYEIDGDSEENAEESDELSLKLSNLLSGRPEWLN